MAVNLRTKPIDRRRLSAQDKSDYNMSRSRKIAGARARRGMMAQRENMPVAHTAVQISVALRAEAKGGVHYVSPGFIPPCLAT